jgi:hypothetical protein
MQIISWNVCSFYFDKFVRTPFQHALASSYEEIETAK